jgi:hypothetical protein
MMRLTVLVLTLAGGWLAAAEGGPDAARGRHWLTTKAYVPAAWSRGSYDEAWRRWPGVTAKPADYDAAFRDYYGLHPAPYPNDNLPMGLRRGKRLLGAGLTVDCLICHGGSIFGKSHIGLGNASLDIQAVFEDLAAADGLPPRVPFTFTRVRGTSEAGAMSVWLLARRTPELGLRLPALDLGLHDDLCEDAPAWWLLKKKRTMYWTGGADQRSVRSIMQFMMSPLTPASAFHAAEGEFADIRQFILSLEAPKYPFSIDPALAKEGEVLFHEHCARCHGTYGPNGRYPNKVIPLDVIGTDRRRFDGITERFGLYYDQTWFAKERPGWMSDGYSAIATSGYQAPPLDGVWATAPYFHNGSVPTIYGVLTSGARPKRFTRSFRTGKADYDARHVGWRVRELPEGPDLGRPPIEQRKVYDTRQPGRGNSGHFFGDDLTEEEKMRIIEYVKTL